MSFIPNGDYMIAGNQRALRAQLMEVHADLNRAKEALYQLQYAKLHKFYMKFLPGMHGLSPENQLIELKERIRLHNITIAQLSDELAYMHNLQRKTGDFLTN